MQQLMKMKKEKQMEKTLIRIKIVTDDKDIISEVYVSNSQETRDRVFELMDLHNVTANFKCYATKVVDEEELLYQ